MLLKKINLEKLEVITTDKQSYLKGGNEGQILTTDTIIE